MRKLLFLACVIGAFGGCKLVSNRGDGDAGSSAVKMEQAAQPGTMRWLLDNGSRPGSGVRFVPTPLVRQARNFTCGAASMQSVMMYWGEEFREGALQRVLKSDRDNGTSYKAMEQFVVDMNDPVKAEAMHATLALDEESMPLARTYVADGHGHVAKSMPASPSPRSPFTVTVKEGKSLQMRPVAQTGGEIVPLDGVSSKELEAYVDAGTPPIVVFQAWSETPNVDWANDWDDGHYAVVVGYDQNNFYFMDPSTLGNYSFIPRGEFLQRWHDFDARVENGEEIRTNVHHFALVVSRGASPFNLDAVPKME